MSGPRPRVAMNMAISLDGKINTRDRDLHGFGGPEDHKRMDELRAEADAVLIGAGTLRDEDVPITITDPEQIRRHRERTGRDHPINVVVCSELFEGLQGGAFLGESTTEKWIFTTKEGDVSGPGVVVEVVPAVDGRVDVGAVLDRLGARGVGRLLLEGGGELNYAMFERGLVDLINVTVCPLLIGGKEAPGMVGGLGFSADRTPRLALRSHRVGADGVLFLQYDVIHETRDNRRAAGGRG